MHNPLDGAIAQQATYAKEVGSSGVFQVRCVPGSRV